LWEGYGQDHGSPHQGQNGGGQTCGKVSLPLQYQSSSQVTRKVRGDV